MVVTDPIADFCTRIRNAIQMNHDQVDVPASKIKLALARVLKDEGYIQDFKFVEDGKQGLVKLSLKRTEDGSFVIREIKNVSKPGLRVYVNRNKIPLVKRGLGIAVVSTSRGVMEGRQAYRQGLGGELLLTVF